LWRLQLVQPALTMLGLDTMVMDSDDALKRHGVKPTYKKCKGLRLVAAVIFLHPKR
jgi:hypothetical protein